MAFDAQAAAGTGAQGLRLYAPSQNSEYDSLAPQTFDFGAMKSQFANQRALAQAVRGQEAAANQAANEQYRRQVVDSTGKTYDAAHADDAWNNYDAAPVEFKYAGGDKGSSVPQAPQSIAVDTSPWHDRSWDFSGVDAGWDKYEADYQKSMNPSNFAPGSPEWQQALSMQGLINAGVNPLHSIQGDPRDPYGYGSDYGRYYDQAHGAGSLQREANRYGSLFAANDPSVRGMQDVYGKIDWDDPRSVEAFFRNANMGGTYTAGQQDRIAQNARTDLTEAALMAAVSAGVGGMAGIGGLGSAWSNANSLTSGLNQIT